MTPKNWDKVWIPDIINVVQAAEIIGVSKRTVQQYIILGKIPAHRKTPTSSYYLNQDEVIEFANNYKRSKNINYDDPYAGETKSC